MSLLKWAQNSIGIGKSSGSATVAAAAAATSSLPTTNDTKSNGSTSLTNGSSIPGVKWIHASETLQKHGVTYVVKFLGNLVVEQTNGIDVVKEAIRKLEFSRQLRKSEAGSAATKLKKVELHVSIDRVAIQEPKSHQVLYQYPLHRISYCADDKGEKNFFAFIAKNQAANTKADSATHEIFVFISDKLAEEITVTIGQAFDLAYKKFLDSSGGDELTTQRRLLVAQQQIQRLELENNIFKQRLLDLAQLKSVANYVTQMQLSSIVEVPRTPTAAAGTSSVNLIDTKSDVTTAPNESLISLAFPVSLRQSDENVPAHKSITPLIDNDNDFDPRLYEKNATPDQNHNENNRTPLLLAPPPSSTKTSKRALVSLTDTASNNSDSNIDIFGMHNFQTNRIPNPITLFDNELLEMQKAFSRGLSLGNGDFSLESLDPLKN